MATPFGLAELVAELAEGISKQAALRPALTIRILGREIQTLGSSSRLAIGRPVEARGDHKLVSKQHLIVVGSDSGPTVADLGSKNGSWLIRDGRRTVLAANAPVKINEGDRVETLEGVVLVEVMVDATPEP